MKPVKTLDTIYPCFCFYCLVTMYVHNCTIGSQYEGRLHFASSLNWIKNSAYHFFVFNSRLLLRLYFSHYELPQFFFVFSFLQLCRVWAFLQTRCSFVEQSYIVKQVLVEGFILSPLAPLNTRVSGLSRQKKISSEKIYQIHPLP